MSCRKRAGARVWDISVDVQCLRYGLEKEAYTRTMGRAVKMNTTIREMNDQEHKDELPG